MKKINFDNLSTAGLIGLAIVVVLLGGYFIFNAFLNNQTENEAKEVVEEFEKAVTVPTNNNKIQTSENVDVPADTSGDATLLGSNKKGSRVKMGIYDVVATIRIPKINANYPVLYPGDATSLEKGVTLLDSLNGINKPGNTTILGHNYRNNMFFSKLHTLKNGDKIYLKGLDGTEVEYTIYHGSMRTPSDGSYIRRETNGAVELSLSTCNVDSSLRYVVLAKKSGE